MILSDHYKTQISVLELGTEDILHFNGMETEMQVYDQFIILVYEKDHYNLVGQKLPNGTTKKIFKIGELQAVTPVVL